jgi:hypothetical protein
MTHPSETRVTRSRPRRPGRRPARPRPEVVVLIDRTPVAADDLDAAVADLLLDGPGSGKNNSGEKGGLA